MNKSTPEKGPVPISEGLFVLPSLPSEKPYLIGNRCRACGETFFPGRTACRRCASPDMEPVNLSRTGKLVSFTTVRVNPPHFIGPLPYLVGVVELPEGERIRTLLTDCTQESLKIGMAMELVIESVGKSYEAIGKIEAETEVVGWKFRPVKRQQQ